MRFHTTPGYRYHLLSFRQDSTGMPVWGKEMVSWVIVDLFDSSRLFDGILDVVERCSVAERHTDRDRSLVHACIQILDA